MTLELYIVVYPNGGWLVAKEITPSDGQWYRVTVDTETNVGWCIPVTP